MEGVFLDRMVNLLSKPPQIITQHIVRVRRHIRCAASVLNLVGCARYQCSLGTGVRLLIIMPKGQQGRAAGLAHICADGEHRIAQWNKGLAVKHLRPAIDVLTAVQIGLQLSKNHEKLILTAANAVSVVSTNSIPVSEEATNATNNHTAPELYQWG
jgi:hypothetical protein